MDAIMMAMAAASETIEALRELARMAKARAETEDPTDPGWQSLAKVTVIVDSLAADLDASVQEAAHGIVAMTIGRDTSSALRAPSPQGEGFGMAAAANSTIDY